MRIDDAGLKSAGARPSNETKFISIRSTRGQLTRHRTLVQTTRGRRRDVKIDKSTTTNFQVLENQRLFK